MFFNLGNVEDTMLDATPLKAVVEVVEAVANDMPPSFQSLRDRLHTLQLPAEFKVCGPWLVKDGAQVDITDGCFNTIETVYLSVPLEWHNSDW